MPLPIEWQNGAVNVQRRTYALPVTHLVIVGESLARLLWRP
jgi:hypothetical protein